MEEEGKEEEEEEMEEGKTGELLIGMTHWALGMCSFL
jgi:hypothetical protein